MRTAISEEKVALATAIAQAREETDGLFRAIQPEAIYERPIDERHRLIFYLGHLEAFDWNQICRAGAGLPPFHAEYDKLFEFGIDPAIGGGPADRPADWPTVGAVRDYGSRVRELVDQVAPDVPERLLHIALEHRLMHAETLAYLLHRLPGQYKNGAQPVPSDGESTPRNELMEIPGGIATLGARGGTGFGWDNEFEEYRVRVPPFRVTRYKITNGEYLAFVRAGGPAPPFWAERGREWNLRCVFGDIPLPLDWPVYATLQQARDYTTWRGGRLPTEPEFHRAAYGTPGGVERSYPWGEQAPSPERGNFDFDRWDPASVDSTPCGASAFGVEQAVGNGWEWTSTVFGPFEGFEPFPTYPGYSANFFDGAHFVLKGGSPRTAARLLRRSFRNWFRPDYPHVYAGFRLAEDIR